MDYSWIDVFCCGLKGCEKEYKSDWDATLYKLCGKMFVLAATDSKGLSVINVKLEPSYGLLLRQEYTAITAGYHMNKFHWNSIYLNGEVPESLVKELILESYDIIFHNLSKKKQQYISSLA